MVQICVPLILVPAESSGLTLVTLEMPGLIIAFIILVIIVVIVIVVRRASSAPLLPPGVCNSDDDCSGATTACTGLGGKCVQCITSNATDKHCPADMPYCLLNQCVKCTDSFGCPSDPNHPERNKCLNGQTCVVCRGDGPDCGDRRCLPDHSACVDCLGDSDCGDPSKSFHDPSKPFCDPSNNRCVGCLTSPTDTCSGSPSAPHCDPKSEMCVRCRIGTDSDCGPGAYCVSDGSAYGTKCVTCVPGDSARACPPGPGGSPQYCVGDPPLCVQCIDGDPDHACPSGQTCRGGQCVKTCAGAADCENTPTPNCVGGVCVACTSPAECQTFFPGNPPPFPYCYNGMCVQCDQASGTHTSECPTQAPVCVSAVCEQCYADGDCAQHPNGSFCVVKSTAQGNANVCVQCTSDSWCKSNTPDTPWCSPDNSCVECDDDHPCGASLTGAPRVCGRNGRCVECDDSHPCGGGKWCTDPSGGQCVSCRNKDDCANNTANPFCDTGKGVCVGCLAGTCPGGAYCADDESGCRQCLNSSQCTADPDRHCSTTPDTLGTCVQCDGSNDCPSDTPHCLRHQCVANASCDQWVPVTNSTEAPPGVFSDNGLYPAAIHIPGFPGVCTTEYKPSIFPGGPMMPYQACSPDTPAIDEVGFMVPGPSAFFTSMTTNNSYSGYKLLGATISYLKRDPLCTGGLQTTSDLTRAGNALRYNGTPLCALFDVGGSSAVMGLTPLVDGQCKVWAGSSQTALLLDDSIPDT